MHSKVLLSASLLLLVAFAPLAHAGSCGSSHGASASTASSSPDLVDVAIGAGSFETLVAAVQAAGLVDVLRGDGPFTVFAPTDEAFAALPAGTVESLLQPENLEQLRAVLSYHVVAGRVGSIDALAAGQAETLQGASVEIALNDGIAQVNGARLVKTDIEASNGIIHVVDAVLLPPADEHASSAAQSLIERAIERGAPLFNRGNEVACAAVYLTVADALIARDDVSTEARRTLERAQRRAGRTRDAADQAWILRDALDTVYEELGEHRMAMGG